MASNVDEVRMAINITSSTWGNYIRDGVITKQARGKYDINKVASEIITWQRTQVRSLITDKVNLNMKLDKVNKKLTLVEAAASTKGVKMVKGKVVQHDLNVSTKEKIDLEISKQKLRKMRHDAKVREKEVMPIDNVFEFVTSIANEFAASLDPLMGSIKQSVPSMGARAHDEMKKSFAIIRNNLSRHIEGKTTNEMVALFDPDNGELDEWE